MSTAVVSVSLFLFFFRLVVMTSALCQFANVFCFDNTATMAGLK